MFAPVWARVLVLGRPVWAEQQFGAVLRTVIAEHPFGARVRLVVRHCLYLVVVQEAGRPVFVWPVLVVRPALVRTGLRLRHHLFWRVVRRPRLCLDRLTLVQPLRPAAVQVKSRLAGPFLAGQYVVRLVRVAVARVWVYLYSEVAKGKERR